MTKPDPKLRSCSRSRVSNSLPTRSAARNTIPRQNAASAVSQPIQNIHKKRYKQTEELKLTERLNDVRSTHGFPHPADSRIVLFNKINCRRQKNSSVRRIRGLPRFCIHLTRFEIKIGFASCLIIAGTQQPPNRCFVK